MKNLQFRLGYDLIPKSLRMEVYQKALEMIESGKSGNYGLCMLLPMCLYGLDSWGQVKRRTDNDGISWQLTAKSFPELGNFLRGKSYFYASPNEERVKFLKNILK